MTEGSPHHIQEASKSYLSVEKILIGCASVLMIVIGWLQTLVVTGMRDHTEDIKDLETKVSAMETTLFHMRDQLRDVEGEVDDLEDQK